MFCTKCGKKIPEHANFCTGCGNSVQMTARSANQENAPKLPQPQKQDMQPNLQKAPEMQLQPNLPTDMVIAQNTQHGERKKRKLTNILSIVLIVLVLIAVGMGVYYFKVLRHEDNDLESDRESARIEVSNDGEEAESEDEEENPEQDVQDEQDEQDERDEQDEQVEQDVETPEAEEIVGVVSDTNEVVGDMILENIPKAVYSYRFDEELGNAEVVVRSEGETMPEASDDVQAQFVHGIDGKAVYLDGTYGIELRDVEELGESYSVAFWMKADELEDWSPFIHIGHDLLNSEGRSRLWLGKKPDTSAAPIISSERVRTDESFEIRPDQSDLGSMKTNVWYHIVFTVDGSKRGSKKGRVLGTLYVDGQYICEGDVVPGMMNEDDLSVYLGINCWDTLYPVTFDEVKIWDQVLDAQQIQELYEAYE